jgi:hypothetical protein
MPSVDTSSIAVRISTAHGFNPSGTGTVRPVATSATVGVDQAIPRPLPDGLLRKSHPVEPVREVGGVAKVLNELSAYLSGRQQAVARMVGEAVDTGSPEQMMKVTAAMVDSGTETDLLAKTIGKTVGAVDQLTKLG